MEYQALEIKTYMVPLQQSTSPGFTYIWYWEVSLYKDLDGKFKGMALERTRQRTVNWLETGVSEEKEALDGMVNICRQNMN